MVMATPPMAAVARVTRCRVETIRSETASDANALAQDSFYHVWYKRTLKDSQNMFSGVAMTKAPAGHRQNPPTAGLLASNIIPP
jgi:hypothetical protein